MDFVNAADHCCHMLTADEIREELIRQLDSQEVKGKQVASKLGIAPARVTEMRKRTRKVQQEEMGPLARLLGLQEAVVKAPEVAWRGPEAGATPLFEDPTPQQSETQDYVPVAILPTFVGAGGGGTGDGEAKYELMPRTLIETELRGHAADFMLVNVRGESMMPDFLHGDQILIDRRDNNPIQPGAFALWDGDAHVIKLVERVPQRRGWYRVFSANQRFSEYEVSEDEIAIIGRPVWFGRRL